MRGVWMGARAFLLRCGGRGVHIGVGVFLPLCGRREIQTSARVLPLWCRGRDRRGIQTGAKAGGLCSEERDETVNYPR